MFDLEAHITEWRKQMLAAGIKSPVPLEELESHLRDHIDRLKSGLSEEEAFRTAAKELGDGKILKKEFSKGELLRCYRNNPVTLNILAGWFVLSGLNAMSQLAWLWHVDWPWTTDYNEARCYISLVLVIFSLQFFVGIGLLRRRKYWQYCALGFSVIGVAFTCWGMAGTLTFGTWKLTVLYIIGLGLELRVPASFPLFIDLLNLTMLLWGIHILAKSSVRNLFRPAAAN